MKNPWQKVCIPKLETNFNDYNEYKKQALENNIQWAIDLLQENGVSWRPDFHTTTLNTNDLEIIKGLLILLKEKVG